MRILPPRPVAHRPFARRPRVVTWWAPFALLAGLGAAEQFEITRWTIDSGGVVHSQGGAYELSGTIGQHDAGSLSGGAFELTGGFWFAVHPADCNDEGLVNLLDTVAFVSCMGGPATESSVACRCFDFNGDARIDLMDWVAVQTGFQGR
jgi:hypothetical protein